MAWDWEEAEHRAGVTPDGRFNGASLPFSHPRALVWKRSDGGVEVLSGDDVHALGRRVAGTLSKLGVGHGDRVAGLVGRTPLAFALPLGLWRLGAVYVPLFSGLGDDAIRLRLADSGASVVVWDEAARSDIPVFDGVRTVATGGSPAPTSDPLARLLLSGGEYLPIASTHKDDPATIMYTSGTTGVPKGCVIPHRAMLTYWPYVHHCLALTGDDLLYSTADTGWAFGLYATGFGVLSYGGSRLLDAGPFEPQRLWRTAVELGATHLASTASAFRWLAATGKDAVGELPSPVVAATTSGEPLEAQVGDWFEQELGFPVHDSYGLTEAGAVIANLRGAGAGHGSSGSMGVALPGFDIAVMDEAGEPVEGPQQVGRIAVRDDGRLLSSTYWNRDHEWRERVRDGWLLTEDLARRDEGGRFWYVARRDDVIVTSGYNVGPFEVEAALLAHPLVVDVVCVGEADARKGQIVAAHVVLAGEFAGDVSTELTEWVTARLGRHCAPRRVYVRTELPRTETGKVRRREFVAWAEGVHD
jgi:acetyl-CoA synthetase